VDEITRQLLSVLRITDGADEQRISKLLAYVGLELPDDYLDFLRYSDGVEGAIGPIYWLALWSIEQLIELNEAYSSSKHAPGLILIGSSLSVTAFGIDTRSKLVTEMSFVVMDFLELEWGFEKHRSCTFRDFIQYLHTYSG